MKITMVATATVAGAFLVLSGAGVAHAGTTTSHRGILSGNRASVRGAIPVDDCGDAIALQEVASAECAGAEWATGVSWDGVGGFASDVARMAGVSWDGGSFSNAEIIGGQFGLPIAMPVSGCGSGVGSGTSSCHGGNVQGKHQGTPLSAASPCPCDPDPCPCAPMTCPCGPSPVHHASPHKPVHHPLHHNAHHAAHTPTAPTPVASRAHGTPTPIMGMLPITGVNLEGITASGFGLLGTGAGALAGAARVTNRKRRRGPA